MYFSVLVFRIVIFNVVFLMYGFMIGVVVYVGNVMDIMMLL